MANPFVVPNLFQVHSGHLHVSYSTSGIDGKPHFHYQDASQSLDFRGDEVRAEATAIGTLVSVRIRTTVDSGSTSFTLLVPTVNLPANQSAAIHTIGITTVHRFSISPALNAGQTELYSTAVLAGTAQHVVSNRPQRRAAQLVPESVRAVVEKIVSNLRNQGTGQSSHVA